MATVSKEAKKSASRGGSARKESARKESAPKDHSPAAAPAEPGLVRPGWQHTPFAIGLVSSLLLWASFPPLGLWPLAWVAPIPWLMLVRLPKLSGWKPYLQIWLAGFVHWLLMLEGIRLAHPALYGGWLALSAYLASYLVLFIAIARVAAQQLRWPLFVAAPLVWIGSELLRSHLISGFASGLLAHTQTDWPLILQVADLGGGYFVSGLMVLVATAIAQMIPLGWFGVSQSSDELAKPVPWIHRPLLATIVAVIGLTSAIGYGAYRVQEPLPIHKRPPLKVALIQGSLDTRFDQPYDERVRETFAHYVKLSQQAVGEHAPIDLVVWPESMFAVLEIEAAHGRSYAADQVPPHVQERFTESRKPFRNMLQSALAAMPDSAFLFGTSTIEVDLLDEQGRMTGNYNTALLVRPDLTTAGRYYKMHAVMFGEFVPCAELFPILQRVTPLGPGLSTGSEPVMMQHKDYRLAPNICFESTVPHLIRDQVRQLERRTSAPIDVIVNVSNDGWFKGSAILDLHFRGNVLRAIENRKPVLACANTGISAHIDGNGRVLARGPKRAPQVVMANITADGRPSWYHVLGDIPAWVCAWITWGLAMFGVWRR